MKKILLIVVTVMIIPFVGCNGNKKQKAEEQTSVSETKKVTNDDKSYLGEYKGTLPCASCPGIDTYLKLNEDGTYDYRQKYLEEEEMSSEENGTYEFKNGLVITKTPSSGKNTYYKFIEDEKALALSDSEGNTNTGELENNYKLFKK